MNVNAPGGGKTDTAAPVSPEKALKKQLQTEGLKQAAEFQQQHGGVSLTVTQVNVSGKLYADAMHKSVELDGQQAPKPQKKDNESLFDFEEVATNVMRFVGGVIRGAANSGADNSALESLFSQAREGVAKGIAMAQRDIGGLMNNTIKDGIDNSRDLIDSRISSLEQELMGVPVENAMSLSMSAASEQTGNLRIKTKDGDELTMSFESAQAYALKVNELSTLVNNDGNENQTNSSQTQYQYFEYSGVSFSLQGELDQEEMTAIADLVDQVNELSESFFDGDIDKAFESALSMGYNEEELTGFALNLTKSEQSQYIKEYQTVQNNDKGDNNRGIKPLADYLKMLSEVDNLATQKLDSAEDYKTLVSGLINRMEDVHVPDLLSAINRFHAFNHRMLDNMAS